MDLNADLACDLVLKLKQLHGGEFAGPDVLASNSVDDGMDESLLDRSKEGIRADITGLLEGLNSDEAMDLKALLLLGRGDESFSNFTEARLRADEAGVSLDDLVLKQPLAASFLASGLDKMNINCAGMDSATWRSVP